MLMLLCSSSCRFFSAVKHEYYSSCGSQLRLAYCNAPCIYGFSRASSSRNGYPIHCNSCRRGYSFASVHVHWTYEAAARIAKCLPIASASIATSAPRHGELVEELGPPIKRPRRYLDMKTFRRFLQQQKTVEIEREKRTIAQMHAKPPPEGWGVLEFLNAAGVGDGSELIAESFGSWEEFISSTIEELYANNTMTNKQRRIILKHITLYNHGMWPQGDELDYMKAFQAPPLKNEGKPWNDDDDVELIRLADLYDAEFGDVWIYISWEMQRTIEDVQDRYINLVIIPKCRNNRCEIAITKAYKPLMMNRKFKLDPPYLYIIPSERNFPLTNIFPSSNQRETVEAKGVFSKRFQSYRRPECFQK